MGFSKNFVWGAAASAYQIEVRQQKMEKDWIYRMSIQRSQAIYTVGIMGMLRVTITTGYGRMLL